MTVPVEAVRLTNDDGSNPAEITPDQVAWWVDWANKVYAVAGIHFTFDPAKDFTTVANSAVNALENAAEGTLSLDVRAPEVIASGHPGKLTVLFRHGGGALSDASAFSSPAYSFVVMTGYVPGACGHVDPALLAHEIGHYFGLNHTFAKAFDTIADATAAVAAGNATSAFDGDGLADTPPDPFVRTEQCTGTAGMVLGSTALLLPRSNVMSYYDAASELSPDQVAIVRSLLDLRRQTGFVLPTNASLVAPIEGESLALDGSAASIPGLNCSAQDMTSWGVGRWSGDRQMSCWLSDGGTATFQLPPGAKAGTRRMALYLTKGPGYGIVQPLVDGRAAGEPIDLYAPVYTPARPVTVTTTFSGSNDRLGLKVVGTNPASGGYVVGLDALTVSK